ncbi:P-loop containing nucleoside triphosphate hydrolase protein [Daedaleopsis nitida]|nr:P-loop containing nucleoside triphosphate hydrolase protein [Daedaleopsis nitida]
MSGNQAGTNGVGLSDSLYAARRRRMLDIANALHLTGVQLDIDLPVIAVLGSQSAGKSSLIESISGITLPRASGTCTRCPTECRLAYSAEPWKCIVSLRYLTDRDGRPLGVPRNEPFGDVIFDKDEVEDRIRRAQRAILNPSTEADFFLTDETDLHELTFSTNIVSLQISGEDVQDLSFCDLPGLIASVGTHGNESDIDLVKALATAYISRPSCIILLTVACETDFQNQGAHRLAKAHDPDGSRTIGVLTKPDRIPGGEEDNWVRFIRNQDESLVHGWFSVKQPDSRAIAAGISWEEAREKEREFFSTVAPWSMLEHECQNRLGTEKLVNRLSDVLSECISQRLPHIQEELHKLLAATDEKLAKLPKPPSPDALSEVLYHISEFSKLLSKHVEGTPNADGLLQTIEPACHRFLKAIRATEPDFRPYTRQIAASNPQIHKFLPPSFLSNEGGSITPEDDSHAIYLDDVTKRAREARTRELPDHVPFIVTQEYITAVISAWQGPAEGFYREVYNVLIQYVKQLVAHHFEQYPLLQNRVLSIVTDFIIASSDETLKRIKWFIELESRPRTLNEPYYADYRNRFRGHYKGWRPKDDLPRSSLTQRINEALGGHGSEPDLEGYINDVLSDSADAAIDIMADVRAYFQVAYKRFTDNIPMAVDFELVLGLDRGQAFEKALRKGLGIGGEDSAARCAEYVKEPRHIAERREELQKKRERLETARKQLTELWL